jgi:hypothetical protein
MGIYKVEKSRIPVIVTLGLEAELEGEIFVQGYAATHYGPERPGDVLNDPHDFFPLALSAQETVLVNKSHVRAVAETSSSREDWRLVPGWAQQQVEIALAGGSRITGSVELAVPGDEPRMLDFLNASHTRFLTLLTPSGTRFVNRAFIESIRLVEAA